MFQFPIKLISEIIRYVSEPSGTVLGGSPSPMAQFSSDLSLARLIKAMTNTIMGMNIFSIMLNVIPKV